MFLILQLVVNVAFRILRNNVCTYEKSKKSKISMILHTYDYFLNQKLFMKIVAIMFIILVCIVRVNTMTEEKI